MKYDRKHVKFHVIRQVGGTDCGLLANAFAVALSFGLNLAKLIFEQHKMRAHLISCILQDQFANFTFKINTNWKKKKQMKSKENIFCPRFKHILFQHLH